MIKKHKLIFSAIALTLICSATAKAQWGGYYGGYGCGYGWGGYNYSTAQTGVTLFGIAAIAQAVAPVLAAAVTPPPVIVAPPAAGAVYGGGYGPAVAPGYCVPRAPVYRAGWGMAPN